MRLVPSSPLSCSVVALGAVVVGGAVLVGCDVIPTDGELWEGLGAEASPSPSPSASAQQAGPAFALPGSCEDIGAAELVGDLAPRGSTADETAGEVEGASDAEEVACSWSGGAASDPSGDSGAAEDGADAAGAPSIILTFTVNTDPSNRAQIIQVPGGQEEMNWEVDVPVDTETYRTDKTVELGGELKYISTVEGSAKHLYLSLPGDFHVSASAMFSDATKEDLEKLVLAAAEKAER
ncbi:hypothetical protein CDO52_03325 [Nocardiopsis gilva YIM 90087]|uniref:DUF3558 domain-containing protein n=1 Tax=Nocardiopsis gilva YIM 90087 TaxID=1235441 RepID=A0A223S1H0_9ACTN|nr:hypothetical protein [Nocardiopsis gilva]ASU81937.1 hypothetical protein CDO52_03325 [Nocardiopsis gilva YIM 90087]